MIAIAHATRSLSPQSLSTTEPLSAEPLALLVLALLATISLCCPAPDKVVSVTIDSVIEVSQNEYCIDGVDYPLSMVIQLNFNQSGSLPNVDLYLDLDQAPLGIQFTDSRGSLAEADKCSKVLFTVMDSCSGGKDQTVGSQTCGTVVNNKYLLNYGSALDPAELSNLKQLFLTNGYFPCPKFVNPINKVINTYLKGGDHVKLIVPSGSLSAPRVHAVTADLPTVLRLNRAIIDVAVEEQSIVAIVGSAACPNEIYSIGKNCHGELGIKSNVSVTCFHKVDRCLFDCQVYKVFSAPNVTFFVTQSGRVYASGAWKCLVHSNRPVLIESIKQEWHTKDLAIGKYHLIGVGEDGTLFGQGDNQLGQLGLCHTQCVKRATCLVFMNRLNQRIARRGGERSERNTRNYNDNETDYRGAPPCKTGCGKRSEGCKCEDECAGWESAPKCVKPCEEKRGPVRYVKARVNKYRPNERLVVKCNSRRCH